MRSGQVQISIESRVMADMVCAPEPLRPERPLPLGWGAGTRPETMEQGEGSFAENPGMT